MERSTRVQEKGTGKLTLPLFSYLPLTQLVIFCLSIKISQEICRLNMLAQKNGVKSILVVTTRRFDSDFSLRVLEKKKVFACFRLILLEIDMLPPSH